VTHSAPNTFVSIWSAGILLGELFDEAELAVAGVVDDDVQASEMVVCLFDRSEVRRAVGDVQLNRQNRVAVRVHQIGQRRGIARRGRDLVAALQCSDRPLPSEATRSTGNEPNFFTHAAL
jgi:hypothetical protein